MFYPYLLVSLYFLVCIWLSDSCWFYSNKLLQHFCKTSLPGANFSSFTVWETLHFSTNCKGQFFTEWRTPDWCFILSLSMFKFSTYYLPDLWGTVRMLPTNSHQHKLLPSSFSTFLSFDFLKFGVRFATLIWLIFFYLWVDCGDVIYFLFSLLLLPFCVLVQLITVFTILGILLCVWL